MSVGGNPKKDLQEPEDAIEILPSSRMKWSFSNQIAYSNDQIRQQSQCPNVVTRLGDLKKKNNKSLTTKISEMKTM